MEYLKRIDEKSDIVCLEDTYGGIEHLMNIDVVLDRNTSIKCGPFTPRNLNAGGSVVLTRKDILGLYSIFEHEENFPSTLSLFLTNSLRAPFKNFDGDFVLLQFFGPLTLKGWDSSSVGDFNIDDPAEPRRRKDSRRDGSVHTLFLAFTVFSLTYR